MYKAIVIGASLGGISAVLAVIGKLPKNFPVPVVIVQHISDNRKCNLAEHYNKQCEITIEEAQEKQALLPEHVYIAPPGYHLLIEDDFTFTLDEGEYVSYARPSIDALFQSATYVYEKKLIAIILTGSNRDGSEGMKTVNENGGYTIVQNLASAESPEMIQNAMDITDIDAIVELDKIAEYIIELVKK